MWGGHKIGGVIGGFELVQGSRKRGMWWGWKGLSFYLFSFFIKKEYNTTTFEIKGLLVPFRVKNPQSFNF